MSGGLRVRLMLAATSLVAAVGLLFAPAASAAVVALPARWPVGLLGLPLPSLPSLQEVVEGIAKDFFGAFAKALVPGWLKHATVSTLQHLVALPDPAGWSHVGQLQSDMTWLGVCLLPAVLAVSVLRYWLLGLTGSAHPTTAVVRAVVAMGVLVGYRWGIGQLVDGANTVTHAVLGLPLVAEGLQRVIAVMWGGALLGGAGGVLAALLVIVAVLLAVALFALKVLVLLVLAGVIIAGPPLIALAVLPELDSLARTLTRAGFATTLVPFAWTVLFATAGALSLDATSFTGGAGGVPSHIEAAFAGLVTIVLAVRLPLMMISHARQALSGATLSPAGHGASSSTQSSLPGVERVRAAQTRLRSVAMEGVPSLGRSAGRAAGVLAGAPAGGPIGAARRRVAAAVAEAGVLSAGAAATVAGSSGAAGSPSVKASGKTEHAGSGAGQRAGGRLANARSILAGAPGEAMRRAQNPARLGDSDTLLAAAERVAQRSRFSQQGGAGGKSADTPGNSQAGSSPSSSAGAAAAGLRPVAPRRPPTLQAPSAPAKSSSKERGQRSNPGGRLTRDAQCEEHEPKRPSAGKTSSERPQSNGRRSSGVAANGSEAGEEARRSGPAPQQPESTRTRRKPRPKGRP